VILDPPLRDSARHRKAAGLGATEIVYLPATLTLARDLRVTARREPKELRAEQPLEITEIIRFDLFPQHHMTLVRLRRVP